MNPSIAPLLLFSAIFSSFAWSGYDDTIPKDYVRNLTALSPQAYFNEINSGWYDDQYLSLKKLIVPSKSYLVLHNRLPSTTFDLRTPDGFRQSVMNLGLLHLKNLDIGHVMLGWHCLIEGKIFEGNTGITGEQENQQMEMANNGWGITGMFSIFKDGHLQTPRLVRSVFRQHIDKQIATLAFEVDPEECANMLGFLNKFLFHSNKPFQRFGLNADPLKFEGGGCGSFSTSMLATSGAFAPIFSNLWREIHANRKVFGFNLPNLPPEIEPFPIRHHKQEFQYVGKFSALFLKNWNASSLKNSVSIRLMDPELLFLAQQTIMRLSLDMIYANDRDMARRLLNSPLIRTRKLREQKLENNSWDSLETPIDSRFDPQSAATVSAAKEWFRSRVENGFEAKGFIFNGHPAVLLSR